ncbi:putative colanic acid biosynthesis acetyltransferase [Pseudomonas endophytica]|uniref:putative colanic acid biosynthesis acetyltransferase n=1 Tax=Pseudomonas endophytica TaxID=1563157 RepID=UPI0009E7F41E|nr:putative colanic acid biosynthesis acetyltransferase [Pseudomonas endophytica]
MIIQNSDPYTGPSFSLKNRLLRLVWNFFYILFFRTSPRPLHKWRALLLKLFGAKIGQGVHIYPGAKIWAPWNLVAGDFIGIADGAIIYNMDIIQIGSYTVISQGAHLCGGSHNYNSPNFQLIAKPIILGEHVWICAEAFISLGVSIPDGVVIGARSLITKPVSESWVVYAGNPARQISRRNRTSTL